MKTYEIDAAQLTLHANIFAAGATCVLATNSQAVVDSFSRVHSFAEDISAPSFELNVLADPRLVPDELANPHLRGMDHLVFGIFNGCEAFAFDLERNVVFGVVSMETARNCDFWNRVLLPVSVGVLGTTMGIVPLHAACLRRNGEALLLAGLSGAGKSTLAVALSQLGFSLISDDWTYMTTSGSRLTAHGLRAAVKLLPDSVRFFENLENFRPKRALNGEMAYEVDPQQAFGSQVCLAAQPSRLIFLERDAKSGCEFVPLAKEDVRRFFENSAERLSREFASAGASRSRVIERIAQLDCWLLRSGASPIDTARAVTRLCDGSVVSGISTEAAEITHPSIAPDLLRRFVDTPFQGIIKVGAEQVLIRSNDCAVVDVLERGTETLVSRPRSFLWKIIRDGGDVSKAYEEASIRYRDVVFARIDPGCVIGIDYKRAELIAFLGMAADHPALHESVVPFLRKLTLEATADGHSRNHEVQAVETIGGAA